ncbi:hypothetical protein SAMN05421770_102195 [Granulicella rosea]|uniref:Uncharacterized protein n=1 Tax=Granulicella rosea TaxID=474952 RepID=A0A239H323_9BACT|nr:hypothetical protein [Granulicella rosea]SNS75545.1 hypothetical protein SAMN05421770_102195 [Granulicella rosea]
MLTMNRTLEEFLDDATLLLHAPEFLDYEDADLEQDLRDEVVLCESSAAIMARMRLAALLETRSPQRTTGNYPPNQRYAARQDEVQPWEA